MAPSKGRPRCRQKWQRRTNKANMTLVDKSARRLSLLRGGEVLRDYRIALGGNPKGHKSPEGDERTPKGDYVIDWRNPNSIAHLNLPISYPKQEDIARAALWGCLRAGIS